MGLSVWREVLVTYQRGDNLGHVVAADRNKEEAVAASADDCQAKTLCWVTENFTLKIKLVHLAGF